MLQPGLRGCLLGAKAGDGGSQTALPRYTQHRGGEHSFDLPAPPCSDLAEQRGLGDHIAHVSSPGHRLGQRREGTDLERQAEMMPPETQVQKRVPKEL